MTRFATGPRQCAVAVIALLLVTLPMRRLPAQVSCSGECTTGAFEQMLLVLPVLSQLTSNAASFSLLPSGGLTATQLATGSFEPAGPLTLTIRTNASSNSSPNKVILRWRATSTTFTSGCSIARSTDLRYGTTSGSRALSVPTSDAILLDNISSSSGLATVSLYFRVNNVNWADAPAATCDLPLTFYISP